MSVEMAGSRDLVEIRSRKFIGELLEIVIDAGDRRDLTDLYTAHSLGRQDFVGGVRVDHPRNQNVRESCKGSPEARSISCFCAVIELIRKCTLDLLNDTDHIDSVTRRSMRREKFGQLAEKLDVISEDFANAGTLNFYYDIPPVAQLSRVHLAE